MNLLLLILPALCLSQAISSIDMAAINEVTCPLSSSISLEDLIIQNSLDTAIKLYRKDCVKSTVWNVLTIAPRTRTKILSRPSSLYFARDPTSLLKQTITSLDISSGSASLILSSPPPEPEAESVGDSTPAAIFIPLLIFAILTIVGVVVYRSWPSVIDKQKAAAFKAKEFEKESPLSTPLPLLPITAPVAVVTKSRPETIQSFRAELVSIEFSEVDSDSLDAYEAPSPASYTAKRPPLHSMISAYHQN